MSRMMDEITVEAVIDNLEQVTAFVDSRLEALDCPVDTQFQIEVAMEELFTNIANYAYAPGTGSVTIRTEGEPRAIALTFIDSGVPYDPLAKEDPDLTLSLEERPIGGLGVYMARQCMDEMTYRREDGKNVTTVRKEWVSE